MKCFWDNFKRDFIRELSPVKSILFNSWLRAFESAGFAVSFGGTACYSKKGCLSGKKFDCQTTLENLVIDFKHYLLVEVRLIDESACKIWPSEVQPVDRYFYDSYYSGWPGALFNLSSSGPFLLWCRTIEMERYRRTLVKLQRQSTGEKEAMVILKHFDQIYTRNRLHIPVDASPQTLLDVHRQFPSGSLLRPGKLSE